jgi:type IV pilus assembly protein PilA
VNQSDHHLSRKLSAAFTLVEIMIAVVLIGLLASMAVPAYKKIRDSTQDKAIINNARQLAAAFDQYTMETGRSSALVDALIGPTSYIKSLDTIAGETYPTVITANQAITILGVASQRTITYQP